MNEQEQVATAIAASIIDAKELETKRQILAELEQDRINAAIAASLEEKRTHFIQKFSVKYWMKKVRKYRMKTPSIISYAHTEINGKETLEVTGPMVNITSDRQEVMIMGERPYKFSKNTQTTNFHTYTESRVLENVGILLLDERLQKLTYEGFVKSSGMEVWFRNRKNQYFRLEERNT